jgi:DNA polymerase-3 subunit delta'
MPLADVAGNREVIAGFEAELARRPSHAYLFAGPRGVGKSIVARGVAHNVLCERAPGARFCCNLVDCPARMASPSSGRGRASTAAAAPRCDCCAACVQIALGVHPDFVYVARQPNRSDLLIEQVRDLIDRLGVRPSRGPRRIAIVDDAETLNLPAQNALLKTLEEPPGYTMMILVASSERALLDTVRSRLCPVRFGPLGVSEIAEVLISRAKLEPERARAIAPLARGSFSRALALAQGEGPPVTELINALDRARVLDFAGAQSLAQDFFGVRDQAAENFELIARLLEEMLCFKLLGSELIAPAPEAAAAMAEIATRSDAAALAQVAVSALAAAMAVDEMANSRLQAEQFWLGAGRALRGE